MKKERLPKERDWYVAHQEQLESQLKALDEQSELLPCCNKVACQASAAGFIVIVATALAVLIGAGLFLYMPSLFAGLK